ncbi:polysaccharide deacetylase family protein [Ferviditalea candida]|uniref:Polysaccharide deacetylase family protein n=1 Tax=Ferviditalea candida TaxID=3108399 RepID=A0ABU5ZJD5_9BACL|nr:polysaccharide deacetylase family protein [Paenibacillaceae bacterium T2]
MTYVLIAVPAFHQPISAQSVYAETKDFAHAGNGQKTEHNVYFSNRVGVLMYHHISQTVKGPAVITPQSFQQQLSYLQFEGFNFITLEQFREFMSGGPVMNNALLVTFDDGYASFYSDAYPILKQLDIPAVNFVITSDLDRLKPGKILHLSRGQILDMTEHSNFIAVQPHTDHLHSLYKRKSLLIEKLNVNGKMETEQQYEQRVTQDLTECIAKLKPLYSGRLDFFAYPYGMFSKPVETILQKTGIRYAFTVKQGMATRQADPYEIPRLNAGSPKLTPEKLKLRILIQTARSNPFYAQENVPSLAQKAILFNK